MAPLQMRTSSRPGVDDDDPAGSAIRAPKLVERAAVERVEDVQRVRRGDLDQAQVGDVGVLADELGVEPDLRAGGHVVAAGPDPGRVGDDVLGEGLHPVKVYGQSPPDVIHQLAFGHQRVFRLRDRSGARPRA